ncbi:hypothetical protein KFL_002200020 [Klebsormidium nitens]|uniref:Uncharacterized protein n=1 Tax=Klebsormidium nitens TaxID=105231 RepID=A0A1Y1I2G4_KLENI|nr:hypothetical protein KFL_002200020 [Klebsormidium nitens]|eukprot:GAQ85115.1 hypothetical protein KFL_002200020 [Klebsormidium nitens]
MPLLTQSEAYAYCLGHLQLAPKMFHGQSRLAKFACVSRRYARIVKEGAAWESACRTFAPKLSEKVAASEGAKSLGSAGWASFAKLLTWCPGYCQETENMKLCELKPIQQHLSPEGPLRPASNVYRREILPAAKKSKKFLMLYCKHDECYTRRWGVDRIVFRGLVGSVEELTELSGLEFAETAEQIPTHEGFSTCPFCPSPLRRFPKEGVNVPLDVSADFWICSSGHLFGLLERPYHDFSDEEEEEDEDEYEYE